MTIGSIAPEHCAGPGASASHLERLLFAPVSTSEFFASYFDRKPLHVANRATDIYRSLFSWRDAEELLWRQAENTSNFVQVFGVHDQPAQSRSRRGMLSGRDHFDWIYRQLHEGYSARLTAIGRYWLPIARAERWLAEAVPGVRPPSTIAYLTPPQAQGLGDHFDANDVFVLQIEGSKTWLVSDPVVELPLLQHSAKPLAPVPAEVRREITLHAGDMLYLPRGIIHAARTGDEASLHLTIGHNPLRWFDLLTVAAKMAEASDGDLQRSVQHWEKTEAGAPLKAEIEGFLQRHAGTGTSLEDLVSRTRKSVIVKMRSLPGNGLVHPSEIRLSSDTEVERAPGLPCLVESDMDRASITFPRHSRRSPARAHQPQTIAGPGFIEPALRFVADADGPFRVGSLPGQMSDNSKVVLAKRLVRDGLLQVSSPTKRLNQGTGERATLEAVLSPLTLQRFFNDIYQQKPYHIDRRPPDAFASLFSREAAEELLWQHEDDLPEIVDLLEPDGSPLSTDEVSLALFGGEYRSWVSQSYQAGGTVRLNGVGRYCLAIARLENMFNEQFPGLRPTETAAYLAPPDASDGVGHTNENDVFVLQIEGTTCWEFAVQPELGATADPFHEATLRPGHILYVPRGYRRRTKAGAEGSVHLAFETHPLRWSEVLATSIEFAAEADLTLRRSVLAPHTDDEQRERTHEIETLLRNHGCANATVDAVLEQAGHLLASAMSPLPSDELEKLNHTN